MIDTNYYLKEVMRMLKMLHKQNNIPWEAILLKLQERIDPLIPKEE